MQEMTASNPAKFGLIGFFLGVASLLVILIQLSAFFEPPKQSAGSVIGEIAADIKSSAKAALTGDPKPAPPPPAQDTSRLITIAALTIAALAITLGGIGLFKNEPHRLPYLAIGFGLSALLMQYVFWLAIIICAVALLTSILNNLDSIFEA